MTIILFLVDTSSSMCQKAFVNGVQKTYLDIAKGAVETFLKFRQRTQDCLGDRYMLLTFEEPPANIKAGWKENHATFMNELKNLQSTGLTTMGESLKNAFDLLNLNRMQSGIDTYGQGRCPFYLEPSVIIVITDGGKYSYRNGVHPEIILPLSTQIPGTKFTKEPFRWDQRLFSLVLRIAGNKGDERLDGKVPHDDSPIERMCEVTGGRSYCVRSHSILNQCLESLVQKVQPGVVLQFEPMPPKEGETVNTQDIVFQPTKKMIYVQKHIAQKTFPIGYWPLPEPYWPDSKALTLHPRDAHPKLKVVTTAVEEPQMVRSFPVDKYEVEACPLTFQILEKRKFSKCWQVIISNGMHGFELPFGYLKATPNFTQVHLYVLAYNYPALLPLLNDLIHKYNMSPPTDLMYKFNSYVRSIPPYYCPFLRKALHNINVPYPLLQFLLPENVDNYLSANIANQLKLIKNTAKQDQENLCMKVFKQLKQPKPPYRQIETAKLNMGAPLRRDLVRHPLLRDTFAKMHAELEPIENFTVVIPQLTRQSSAKSYRNPFDIPRRDLIGDISRMRETLLRPTPTSLVAKDSGHCLPIAEMGNYQEYLKNKDNPLREIEPTNVRQHMFGNPYKKDKHMVMVDEADLGEVAPIKAQNNNNNSNNNNNNLPQNQVKKLDARVRKRKAGPIRKDYVFKRSYVHNSRASSPALSTSSGASSPAPSMSSYGSDYDDDSMSDTSSISGDDGDPNRLVMSFDFNEEEKFESDFPLNGYVRNFINGMSEEQNANANLHAAELMPSANNMNHTAAASLINNGGHMLSMNSNGSLTPVPGVPASPPNSPQHPYLSNYGTNTNHMLNSPQQQQQQQPQQQQQQQSQLMQEIMPAFMNPSNIVVPSNGVIYYPQQHLNGGYGHVMSPMLNNNPLNVNANLATTQMSLYNVTHMQQQQHQQQQHQQQSMHTPLPNVGLPMPIQQQQHLQAQFNIMQQQQQQQQQQHLTQHMSAPPTTLQQQHAAAITTVQQQQPTLQQLATTMLPQAQQQQQQHHQTQLQQQIPPPQMQQQQQQQPQAQPPQPQAQPQQTHLHNDINDAQEISRILQQSYNNGNSLHNNNNNNSNNNNDTDVDLMPPPMLNATTTTATSTLATTTTPTTINHQNSIQGGLGLEQQMKAYNNIENGLSQLTNSINYNQQHPQRSTLNQQQQHTGVKGHAQQKLLNNNNNKIVTLTDEQRDEARKNNLYVRTLIFRDIRRPGRNYTQLLDHLNLLKGDVEMKSHFVDMCIYESQRFRRQQMAKSIESWWEQKKKLTLTNSS